MSVDSTNNYAMEQIHVGKAIHGNVYFAHFQTAGKGQRGKIWAANPSENIMMSILLAPQGLPIQHQFVLSAAVALSCYELLKKYFQGEVYIKWPNDLYLCDRKAGGILIENILTGNQWKYAVVGIGLNINQVDFDPLLPNPTSLKMATGENREPLALAKELCAILQKRYQEVLDGNHDEIMKEYNDHLYKCDDWVKLKNGERIFDAKIKKVAIDGQLHIETDREETYRFGELQWIL